MARWIHSLLLFPAALVLLILSKAHAVAKASLVPSTVRSPEDLVRANGRLAMLAAIVGFVAAGPATAILKLLDGAWVLRLAAVMYLAGTVMALRLRPGSAAAAQDAQPVAPVDETLLNRGVTLAATSMASLRAIVGFLTFAVAFEFRRTHAPTWWYGLVLGASLLGSFAGAVVGPWLRTVVREERILGGSVWLVALVALIAGRFGSRPALSLLALTVGLAAGTGRLAFDAIVQRDGVEQVRARSFARFEATFQLVWVAAALVPVVVPIPARVLCFVLALGAAMAGVFYISGRRALRPGVAVARPSPGQAPAPDPGPEMTGPGVTGPRGPGPGGVRWLEDEPASEQ
jgi:hypothetical protein